MPLSCSSRLVKNARFLQRPEVAFIPSVEPLDGFGSLVPTSILGRLERLPLEQMEDERLVQVISKKRPPSAQVKLASPLFSGTLRFVQATFTSRGTNLAVPDADLSIAMTYASLAIVPISAYCSQYGPNSLVLANTTVTFKASTAKGKFNDSTLSGWVDELAEANALRSDSCLVFLSPQGIVNTDADPTQGVLGYHSVSRSGVPYAFVNVMGDGLTIDDAKGYYALALSHEIAEMTVDPLANGSNPEVCDECLPPDQFLLGDNKPISEYVAGSMITGQGGLQGVTRKIVHEYTGDLVEIKALGMLPFTVTPNHPLLVVKGRSRGLSIAYDFPQWKEAGILVTKSRGHDGDYLVMPRIPGNRNDEEISLKPYILMHQASLKQRGRGAKPHSSPHIEALPLNEDVAWMFGLYVAEGSPNPAHRSIEFSLHSDETTIVERLGVVMEALGFHLYTQPVREEKGVVAIVCSVILAKAMPELCGKGAKNKRIPDAILYHSDEKIIRAFLHGYQQGDGSKKVTQGGFEVSSFTTISKILALQLQLLYGRLGTFISLQRARGERTGTIQGRLVKMSESFVGSWCSDSRATRRKRLHPEGGINGFYLPVKWAKKHPYSGEVYNLETDDHTYLVNNAITHNCAGNCNVDYRNYFDAGRNWLGGSPTPGYYFFIDGIATPATVAQCPAPASSCSYPPPKPSNLGGTAHQ